MSFPALPELLTARLELRPVQARDLPDLFAVNGDAQVTRFLPYATWQTAADGEAWLARMQTLAASGTACQLVMVRRADGRAIGTVLLFRLEAASARLELGYVVGRTWWRQGYAHEAMTAVITAAFGPLQLRRLEAEVDTANVASNALLARLGFTLEGRLRQRWVGRQGAYDVNLWGRLRDDR